MSSQTLKLNPLDRDRTEPAGPTAPFDLDAASRAAELARACRTAARAVSLYPGAHPAIRASLTRLSDTVERATAAAPLSLTVLPTALTLAGSGTPVADASAGELAALLHAHYVGALTIHPGTDIEAWRTFLLLLARSPEDVKVAGGIGRLWSTSGTPQIELREIDYAQVLKERSGQTARWEDIVRHCLQGDAIELTDEARHVLLETVVDVSRLTNLARLVEEQATKGGPRTRVTALLQTLHGIADLVSREQPENLETVLQNMAAALGNLSVDTVLGLLRQSAVEPSSPGHDLMAAMRMRMSDDSIAAFVARAVTEERAASARLVEAFQTLVPQPDRQHRLLQHAQEEVSQSPLGDEDDFNAMWENVAEMLTSDSDSKYVSEDYGRELSGMRTQALEVDQVSDDPPERVTAWLTTVSDAAIRALDLQVLLDMLAVESEPDRWRDMIAPVLAHVEDLLLVGDFASARRLIDVLLTEARGEGRALLRPLAEDALQRLVRGPMMRHVVSHLRTIDDQRFGPVKELCQAVGAGLVEPLAEALAAEDRERPRRRLTELLMAFGSIGRRAVEQLKNSPNAAVRRTAIHLLREFGGTEALPELASLLDDVESHVQREAIRAIVAIASNDAYAVLEKALVSGRASSRDAIMEALGSMRDEQASPLFSYIVSHVDHRGPLRSVYARAIEALGELRDPDAVDVLKDALYRGEWHAPFRTSALRRVAAAALRRIGSPQAIDVLRDAAGQGSRGVRAAARAHLRTEKDAR